MSKKPEPKEVELVCGCCGRRDNVNPTTARYWPECCGRRMDRHTDASANNPKSKEQIDWDNLTMCKMERMVLRTLRDTLEKWSKEHG